MAIKNEQARKIAPAHPGEMLREDFLPDYKLTTTSIAEALGVSRQTVNELLREKRSISSVMALRLSRLFGNRPEFWLKAQQSYDLWQAEQQYHADLKKIQPLTTA